MFGLGGTKAGMQAGMQARMQAGTDAAMRADGPAAEIPYLIAINLTRRCNLACAHCYMDAEQRSQPAPGEMDDAALAALFREIGERAPGAIIVLTGGEPLMHPGLEGLVAAGSAAGLRMVLGTNGVLLTEAKALRLKQAGLEGMGISLDSVSPASHDAFRGMAGAFAKTCEAVRICVRAGLHAQIHFTVTRRNRAELRAAVAMAKGLGASILNFFFLVCVGRGESRMDLTATEYEHALVEIRELQASAQGILVQTRCTPHFKRVMHAADAESPFTRATGYDGGGCLAATRYCRITPKGEVTPCPYIELSGGNVREAGFWPVWEGSRLFRSLRDPGKLEGRCGSCEYKLICGGCRARALVDAGNLMGEDPSCGYQPQGKAVIQPEAAPAGQTADWTPEALARLANLPLFLRPVIKKKLEARAKAEGVPITVELMRRHKEERERELGLKFK
jgi:radical SAM protein with 4Fe4S-binding SPASM domain